MVNSGVVPVNPETNVGKVRILLGDTQPDPTTGGYLYFSDTELSALLDMYDDNPKLVAARCMETIAASEVLLLKSWSSDDLAVRGDQIAESLRKIAQQLRDEAIMEESSNYFNLINLYVAEDETWWN